MRPDYESTRETGSRTRIRTDGGNAAFHNFHNDFSHIVDPNLRRRLALTEIDKIPLSWYHARAVAVAGAGFFADSYDLFAINLAVQMLGMTYWQENGGMMPSKVETAIKAATSGGAVLGQLIFGWLADVVGRKKMYGIELIILVVATLGQSLASSSTAITISALLIFERVVMGLGVGGDYPMSAIITSEFAPTRWRGTMIAAVFSMQGLGQFVAAMVALITTVGFRESFVNVGSPSQCSGACQMAADRSWRIIIGFGALPAIFALYYRLTIPETPRFTFDVTRNFNRAEADIRSYTRSSLPDPPAQPRAHDVDVPQFTQPRMSWSDFISHFSQWRHGKVLFATMASWFLLDFAFYGLGLNNATILAATGYSSGSTVHEILYDTAVGNLVLVCAGAIPGYWMSVLTMDFLGRRPIQIVGFLILTILFCVIGFAYNSLSKSSLLALYILSQFFFNFGPNATTFIVPGECFPTRYRSTCHGLSAASGKIGATIAQVMAPALLGRGAAPDCKGSACTPWLGHLMQVFALFMLLGMTVSFLIPETNRRSLEDLAGEPLPELAGSKSSLRKKEGFWAKLDSWFEPYWKVMEGGWGWGEKRKRKKTGSQTTLGISRSKEGLVWRDSQDKRSDSHASKRPLDVGSIQMQDLGGLIR